MDRQRLFAQLRLHEGVERKPYQCTAGYLTIGVGRNIEERGLSDDEIDSLGLSSITTEVPAVHEDEESGKKTKVCSQGQIVQQMTARAANSNYIPARR